MFGFRWQSKLSWAAMRMKFFFSFLITQTLQGHIFSFLTCFECFERLCVHLLLLYISLDRLLVAVEGAHTINGEKANYPVIAFGSWISTLFPDHALRSHAILDDIVLILDLNIHPSFGKGEGHFLKSLLAQTNWHLK